MIVTADRFTLDATILIKVFLLPDPAGLPYRGDKCRAYLAGIETRCPMFGHGFEGVGKSRLLDEVAKGRHLPVLEEYGGSLWMAAQHLKAETCHAAVMLGHREAIAGVTDRRGQYSRQGQAAIRFADMAQGCRFARDACCKRAVHRGVSDNLALVIQVHVPCGREWCPFAAIDHGLKAVPGAVQQPEAAATYPRTIGLDHCQGSTDRHRCIEGIPTGAQDFLPCCGSQGVGGGNCCCGGLLRAGQNQRWQ